MKGETMLKNFLVAWVLGTALAGTASAQIIVGQTASFSGPVAAGVKETAEGAKLYIDKVNADGGVHGQKIELLSMDDKFDPELTVKNARTLIVDKKVVALFLVRGTPQTLALMPLLAEYRVPLVAPSTGAMQLHQPVNPYIFNVRPSYQHEAERVVKHLSLVGMDRIAVLQADDSFGSDAVIGALAGFKSVNKEPVLVEKFNRINPDFAPLAAKVMQANAQAVLFIGSGTMVVDGTKAIRAAGSGAQIVTLSNNAASGFIAAMGSNARGTIVSQVFPYERSVAFLIVKEALELAQAKNIGDISPALLEGYAAAKVLVEGLRRAGARPTREKLIAALNGLNKFDIGGLEVSYSPGNHTGLSFVDLSIIGADGKFRR